MKRGAIAVPLFTLFGPDGVRLARRRLLAAPAADERREGADTRARCRLAWSCADDAFGHVWRVIRPRYDAGDARRRSGDLPVHVRHNARTAGRDAAHPSRHRRGHDRGALWHRHPARATGSSVRHRRPGAMDCGTARWRRWRSAWRPATMPASSIAERMLRALQDFDIDQPVGGGDALPHDDACRARRRAIATRCASCRSPASRSTATAWRSSSATFGTRLCSMYGTTEVGVILANYPGAEDFPVKPGALGVPVPGVTSRCSGPTAALRSRTRSARSRCGDTAHGSRPRIAAGSMPMATSTMPGARTT